MWIYYPSPENHQAYKKARNQIKSMIRQAKQEAKYKKLGVRLSPKTVYGILKVIKRKNQPTSFMQNYKRVFCFHKPTAIIQASQNGHEFQKPI